MILHIATWWFAIQLLGLAALPLTTFLFRSLPDRGYAFSKSLGLLLTGYLAWLLAMLGVAGFSQGLLIACALAMAVGGGLLARERSGGRGQTSDKRQQPTGVQPQAADSTLKIAQISPLANSLSALAARLPGWRTLLGYETLFLLALVFVVLLRGHEGVGWSGPNPWGTERPMDFAFFNAIQRSPSFPPHDPWLAGYSINYYYFGYLLMAALGLLTGIEPGVAYNLSLAVIFALTALGIAGVVVNLLHTDSGTASRIMTRIAGTNARNVNRQSAIVTTLVVALTVVLVLLAGNQGGALEVISGSPKVLSLGTSDMLRAVINGLGPREPLYLDQPHIRWGDAEATTVITPTDRVADFDWWQPSRALWDRAKEPGNTTKFYAITEFPFFSFWLGDMHPHVMALPFGLLALALALQTALRPAAPAFALNRRGWADLLLTGVVLGSLYLINSWDFPTYLLLYLGALALLFARLAAGGTQHTAFQWQMFGRSALLVVVAAIVLFVPFHMTFRSLVGSREPLIDLPILATLTRTIGVVYWDKTTLHTFFIIFGLFLVPLLVFVFGSGSRQPFVVSRLADEEARGQADLRAKNEDRRLKVEGSQAATLGPQPSIAAHWRELLVTWLPLVTLAVLVAGPLIGFPLLVLLPLALYAGLLALQQTATPGRAFVLWVFALGCLVCFGTELIYLRDNFDSRMNTIFKFYYQVWLLWGVLAGYALWWMLTRATEGSRRRAEDGGRRTEGGGWKAEDESWRVEGRGSRANQTTVYRLPSTVYHLVAGALFFTLLAGALIYPWLTAGKSFREAQFVGIAGKTPRQSTAAGAAAINWLRQNARPDAVVLEAVGPSDGDAYDSRGLGIGGVSASTGLATVLGWGGHQQQWRAGDPVARAEIGPRRQYVTEIYSGTLDLAATRALLAQYQVAYIYVGAAEQASYPAEGLARLAELGTPVFQQDEVTIYRVNP